MICYICNEPDRQSPAVAICIVCGMGLCREHVVREEVPVYETVSAGMTPSRHKLPETLPRILCPPCHKALHQK
jgi:hypothetical protein